MNNTEFLKQMITLTHELERAAEARPYDPDAYNDVVDRLNNLYTPNGQRRRRRPWPIVVFILSLLSLLAFLVYCILCPV